jgi:nitrate reductase gamma subunit
MSMLAFLIAAVLPYAAATVFVAGLIYRLVDWWRRPRPPLMTLYPTRGAGWAALAREAALLPGLRRGDPRLWLVTWPFHLALALVLLGHVRAVTSIIDRALSPVASFANLFATLAALLGSALGALLALCALALVVRRIVLARVRESSTTPDFFVLLLLLAVIISGDVMRWSGDTAALAEARRWASSLMGLSPIVPALPSLLVHVFFAELLLAYFAFSRLMHAGGIFFSIALLKRSAS